MWEMAANVLKWVCRMTGITRFKQPAIIGTAYYDGPEASLDEIEAHLLKFSGGSIDLKIHDDGIATLCISNYEKRNAISGKMMVDLRRAVSRLEAWAYRDERARGLLLHGAGGTFCSGGDLQMARRAVGPHGAASGFHMACYMHHTLARLASLPLLSAALIEGTDAHIAHSDRTVSVLRFPCRVSCKNMVLPKFTSRMMGSHQQGALGGGAELALACDWRLATHDARGIGLVHARMGVAPAWGGGQRLVRLLGRSKALEVLATANVFSPKEALAMGLIDHIIPAAEDDSKSMQPSQQPFNATVESRGNSSSAEKMSTAMAAAREWLRQRTRHPPEVLRAIKAICDGAVDERRVFAPLWGGVAQVRAIDSRVRHP